MRLLQVICFIAAIAVVVIGLAIHRNRTGDTLIAAPHTVAVANIDEELPPIVAPSALQEAISEHDLFSGERGSLLLHDQKADFEGREQKTARKDNCISLRCTLSIASVSRPQYLSNACR